MIFFLFLNASFLFSQDPIDLPPDGEQVSSYENGAVKEKIVWKSGLVTSRELYDKNGNLLEKHFFDQPMPQQSDGVFAGKGIIRSYYPDGSIASVVPVYQVRDINVKSGESYVLKIYGNIKGYYKGKDTIPAYEYTLPDPLLISGERSSSYREFNFFYNDVFLLYPDISFPGLVASVKTYFPDGKTAAEYEVVDGLKSGKYKDYRPNGNVKSEGTYKKTGMTDIAKIGNWKFFREDGTIESEREFFPGGRNTVLKPGDPVNKGKFYYPDGTLHFVIAYAFPGDQTIRQDTTEIKYPDGRTAYKYLMNEKISIFNPVSGKPEPYDHSGKIEKYNEKGGLTETGYISNIPRKTVSQDELNGNPCIMKDNKKIGSRYYFNDQGVLIKIEKYDICGNLIETLPEKEVKKIAKTYEKEGILDFTIRL
ncbi:MAG: hypothetical protein KJ607_01800 [Bacteroidetes bacterium]|nr:hypothetical protein [Bacteroidota bacterium]